MSRWFRFYDAVLDDPKVQKLPPHLFKAWVNILCLSSVHGGTLPTIDDMAFRMRVSAHDMQSQIDQLIDLGLVDIRPDTKLEPHNWAKRQFSSDHSADRVRNWRKSKGKRACNGDVTLHVTAPDTDTDTDTDQNRTEQRRAPPKFLKEKLYEDFEAAFKARVSDAS